MARRNIAEEMSEAMRANMDRARGTAGRLVGSAKRAGGVAASGARRVGSAAANAGRTLGGRIKASAMNPERVSRINDSIGLGVRAAGRGARAAGQGLKYVGTTRGGALAGRGALGMLAAEAGDFVGKQVARPIVRKMRSDMANMGAPAPTTELMARRIGGTRGVGRSALGTVRGTAKTSLEKKALGYGYSAASRLSASPNADFAESLSKAKKAMRGTESFRKLDAKTQNTVLRAFDQMYERELPKQTARRAAYARGMGSISSAPRRPANMQGFPTGGVYYPGK